MRTHDEAAWQQQLVELEADGEPGVVFRRFLETWVDRAEELMWEGTGGQPAASLHPNMSPVEALRMALEPAEAEHGRSNIGLIGQILVVLCTFWEYGDELAQGLTAIELRLVQDTLALKIAALQAEAAEEQPDADSQS